MDRRRPRVSRAIFRRTELEPISTAAKVGMRQGQQFTCPLPTFAAVDIGSNSVRLKIARLTRGRLRSIHEDREVTRLGDGVFRSGFLTPESMAETVKVLRRFHRATQQVVTDPVRVVATSALRDARNSQAFLEWVRSATGWRVEIISGVEEARLIHLGLVSSPRVDKQ